MKITPVLVIQTDYNEGVAFEGDDAAALTKLLMKGRSVVTETRNGRYGWHPADSYVLPQLRLSMMTRPIDWSEECDKIRNELSEVNKKLNKHAEMIEAAEALAGEEESS